MKNGNQTKRRFFISFRLISAIVLFFITGPLSVPECAGAESEQTFSQYYSLTPIDVTPQIPPYSLPLDPSDIVNYEHVVQTLDMSPEALDLLRRNGFVVTPGTFQEDITAPYKTFKDRNIPLFITADSLLHLYHIQFAETLRRIEEDEFYDAIWEISEQILDYSLKRYRKSSGEVKEAAKRNVAYCAVALRLLEPRQDQLCVGKDCRDPGIAGSYFSAQDLEDYDCGTPECAEDLVEAERSLIEAHEGFSPSPLFLYLEDYSQYVPRGHYTRSEKLKNYFKAFMWYGRMSMLLKGSDSIPPGGSNAFDPEGMISTYDARIQTLQAGLLAQCFSSNEELQSLWDRVYTVTAFYVGLSDDLGPYEYMDALESVTGGKVRSRGFDDATVEEIKVSLAQYGSPKIFGGTGNCGLVLPFTPEQADECLDKTAGFRLMGQRFIPDSYMFSRLVGGYTGVYTGERNYQDVFTAVLSPAGTIIRGFPRGLDVMAILGSGRSREILLEMDDAAYRWYDFGAYLLWQEFASFDQHEWTQNLYWSWLFALKVLLEPCESGYPSCMQTTAWQDKSLHTALASWAELRHDTILYAKQSYTMVGTSMPVIQEIFEGYVEPLAEFYNRLLALTRMTTAGLDAMNVLDDGGRWRLRELETVIEKLMFISLKELRNEPLSKEEYTFIRDFEGELFGVLDGVDEKAKKTTIVADVHTDGNTGQVLEEGVGYVDTMVVAYRVPDGRIVLGAGPTMSYYEFKHPMANRLTDEAWREMLKNNPPERPGWATYLAR